MIKTKDKWKSPNIADQPLPVTAGGRGEGGLAILIYTIYTGGVNRAGPNARRAGPGPIF